MNETNPYSTPQTDVSTHVEVSDHLRDLDFKRLKKMYHRSSNVNVITFLLGLGMIFITFAALAPDSTNSIEMRIFLFGLASLYAIAVVGLFKRTAWGRILGIMISILTLFGFPLGTLIGACGLFAFFGAPQLFGKNRVTHREVKAEFYLQKANLKKNKKSQSTFTS